MSHPFSILSHGPVAGTCPACGSSDVNRYFRPKGSTWTWSSTTFVANEDCVSMVCVSCGHYMSEAAKGPQERTGSPFKIHVLFGLRNSLYQGEYAPEALAVQDEYGQDENPDYLKEQYDTYAKSGDFTSLAVIGVTIPMKSINEALKTENILVSGTVVTGENPELAPTLPVG